MHCTCERTSELRDFHQRLSHGQIIRKKYPTQPESLTAAKKGIQHCIEWYTAAFASLQNEESVDLDRVKHAFESPAALKSELQAELPQSTEFETLFHAVFSKRPSSTPSALETSHRQWISHYNIAFHTLLRKLYAHYAAVEKTAVKESTLPQPKAAEASQSQWGLVNKVSAAVQNRWNAFPSEWSILAPVEEADTNVVGDNAQTQAVQQEAASPTLEGTSIIKSAMEIAQLNSFIDHLVAEQNHSVSAIVEDTQENAANLTDSNEQLVAAKQARQRLFHLAARRVRILCLLLASLFLGILHVIVK